ncbi:uncharacterized protein IAS62_000588 [Cryptococcus decagattii]|uniref:Peptidase M48 domain-containing protein n=1 Tax=Cryptococcus decagattii TaxID=1859122 RepID=A0ABZ2AM92_9TREE
MPASITKTLPFITTTTVSTSRIPTLSFSHLSRPPYSLYSPRFTSTISHGKGKNKARNHYTPSLSSSNPLSTLQLLNHARYRIAEHHVLPRSFHASARRDAIPLIPVGISVVKGASVLTAATAFSRIVISFLPIGTIAAFKMIRLGRWIESGVECPTVSPQAEEFFKMWCEGEKSIKLKPEEANALVESQPDNHGGLTLRDGRVAYSMPLPPSKFRHSSHQDPDIRFDVTPKMLMEHFRGNRRKVAFAIRRRYYIIPPLPPSAEAYYNSLGSKQQAEIDSLRRYWLGLKTFKDCFKWGRWFIATVFLLPFLLICGAYVAGLERVPLTGRWRLILLTPEEEDAISTSLAGGNWYRSVINLLTTPERPAPPILPTDDWRWAWVQSVLTRLETAALIECQLIPPEQKPHKEYDSPIPLPPPTYHPFKPRPRASSLLHSVLPGGEPNTGREHLEVGPPYNIMLLQKDEQNAFSYGFGGKKAGGIVVYTGLLDEILRHSPPASQRTPQIETRQSGFLSGLFSTSRTSNQNKQHHTQPTAEQNLHLACILAHEMGHLLLSHHLETLSQQQVLWPSVLGFSMDLIRAFIWPLTVFLGPTVNDALANMGRTSSEELADKYGEIGFQWKHEYEADLAGLRILARAGYDPRAAVSHFQSSVAGLHEIQPDDKADNDTFTGAAFKLWTKATHPSAEQRTDAIRKEIDRWQEEEKKTTQK